MIYRKNRYKEVYHSVAQFKNSVQFVQKYEFTKMLTRAWNWRGRLRKIIYLFDLTMEIWRPQKFPFSWVGLHLFDLSTKT